MNVKKEALPLPQSGASTEIPGPYLSPEQTESYPLTSKSTRGRIGAFICCCFWPCYHASNSGANGLRPVMACFFTFSLALTVALGLQMHLGEPQVTPQGSVASDSRECSQIGAAVLKKGGNAVDAAVATTICLGVILPHITGLGGGGFMAIYDHRHHHVVDAIDFREQVPFSANMTEGFGGQSVGVPGLLKGLSLAHLLYGRLPWAELIKPSIDLCKSGFLVPSNLITARNQLISSKASDKSLFWNHFESLEAGHDVRNLQMAATLQDVAEHGSQALYNGSLTDDLVESSGGCITRSDLEKYEPIRREMLRVPFGQSSWVYSMGYPSGGPLVLTALRLIDASPLPDSKGDLLSSTARPEDLDEAFSGNVSVEARESSSPLHSTKEASAEVHSGPTLRAEGAVKARVKREDGGLAERLLEALRDASLLHSLVGSPSEWDDSMDYSEIFKNPAEILKGLKDPKQQDRLSIEYSGRELLRPSGTNVAVIDSKELYVSVVSGLGSWFGSQVLTAKGYVLNGALSEGGAGSPSLDERREGRRSSSAVAFVVPRKGQDDIGACGQRIVIGSADALSLVQVLVNILLKGSSLVEGIEYQRIKPLSSPESYGIEVGLESSKPGDENIILDRKGTPLPLPYASVNGIQEIGDTLASHSDSRGGGVAARF